jgi:hypothetical protein
MSQSWPRGGDPQAAKVSGTPTDGQGLAYDAASGLFVPVDLASTATFATDAELAAGLATKQDAATAATDAELAAHEADTTSIHGIADTGALATDAEVAAGYQPLDSDLSAIAALTTTSFGRSVLAAADAAALRTLADAQPVDSDLTAIAALSTTSFGRALLELVDAAALRSAAGLGDIATADDNDYMRLRTAANRQLGFGTTTITFSTNTAVDKVITHGMGGTPVAVFVTNDGTNAAFNSQVHTIGATQFTCRLRHIDNTTSAGTWNIWWLAII